MIPEVQPRTQDIGKLPLCFIMTFGHCGVDWLHSLFDSHPQVLLMPAFSYYRSWNAIGAARMTTVPDMVALWRHYIEHNPGMRVDRRKLFYDDATADRFFVRFEAALQSRGLTRRGVFLAIHEAYAGAIGADVSKFRIVMAQEHLTFPIKDMIVDFPEAKVLQIVRDPRASLAGGFKHQSKRNGYLTDFDFNIVTEFWLQSISMWKHCRGVMRDRYRVVRNEDLHAALEDEMRKLAAWLGIEYSPLLLQSTFSNKEWVGESAWMTADNKYPEEYDVFYAPENVRKRWMAELSPGEIAMAEFLTRDVMAAFGYERLTRDTLRSRARGFLEYLRPNRRLAAHWRRTYPNIDDFDRVARKLEGRPYSPLWKYLPARLKLTAVAVWSTLLHGRNYFAAHNRGSRYV